MDRHWTNRIVTSNSDGRFATRYKHRCNDEVKLLVCSNVSGAFVASIFTVTRLPQRHIPRRPYCIHTAFRKLVWTIKADLHIACSAPATPCRQGFRLSFPFDLHSAIVSDSHLPCHAHAMLRPCRSTQGQGTARSSRDGLWAACPRSASSGYHAEFHEGSYQKHTNLRGRWPVWNQTFVMNEEKSGSSTLQ